MTMLMHCKHLHKRFFTIIFLFISLWAKGQSFTLNIPNNTDNIQWQSSADNSNWSDLPGGNVNSILTHPMQTTYYRARMVSPGCSPIYSDVKAAYFLGDTLIGAMLIKGQVVLPQGANIDLTSFAIHSLLGNNQVNHDGTFQLLIGDSAKETQLLVTNSNGDVAMAADFIGPQTNYLIDAGSTAIDLLLTYPFLEPVDTAAKHQLIADYEAQPEYAGLVTNVETIIKTGSDIFSQNNTDIQNSIIALVSKSYDDYRASVRKPKKKNLNSGLSAMTRLEGLKYYFGFEPISITQNDAGSIITIQNNEPFSYVGSIYRTSDNLNVMPDFVIAGSLLHNSEIIQVRPPFIKLPSGSSESTHEFDLKGLGNPGQYKILLRSGFAFDGSGENQLAFQENAYELTIAFLDNLPGLAELNEESKCLGGLVNAIVDKVKIALTLNPNADYVLLIKTIVLPGAQAELETLGNCAGIAVAGYLGSALKVVNLYLKSNELIPALKFLPYWAVAKTKVDGCKLMDANNNLVNCFQFSTVNPINASYNSCDIVPLTIQATALPDYYPYDNPGAPVPNLNFVWTTLGGGSFSPNGLITATGQTDDQGVATINWVMPPNSGAGKVYANVLYNIGANNLANLSLSTTSLTQSFTASALGNNQDGRVGDPLIGPIFIYLADQNNAPVPTDKFNVTWNLDNNGTVSTAGPAGIGRIGADWVLGPTLGEQDISASVESKTGCDLDIEGSPVPFTAIAHGIPVVTTFSASAITQNSALTGGSITSSGGFPVIADGVCWSTAQNPTTADPKTTDATGTSTFASSLQGLQLKQLYYARAYVTDFTGTYYGNQVSFTTLNSSLPILTTTAISNISNSTATGGGSITDSGGNAVSSRGICWDTAQNPTIAKNKTSDGTGIGNFLSMMSGLKTGLIYYVRAYATNSLGTAYGNQVQFSPAPDSLVITTSPITGITGSFAVSGGNIVNAGIDSLANKGICWSISANPTTANFSTSTGGAPGSFVSLLTNLTINTTYYVRAYGVTSTGGVFYGNQLIFTTPVVDNSVSYVGAFYADSICQLLPIPAPCFFDQQTLGLSMILSINNGQAMGIITTPDGQGYVSGPLSDLILEYDNGGSIYSRPFFEGRTYEFKGALVGNTYSGTGTEAFTDKYFDLNTYNVISGGQKGTFVFTRQ
jgi:hypothetical protein